MVITGGGYKLLKLGLLVAALLAQTLSAHAQLQLGATSFGQAFRKKIISDTTALLNLRARRIGVSTYSQQSDLRGRLALDRASRQLLRFRVGTDWIYDSRGQPPFVREDYRLDLAHVLAIDQARHWHIGQQIHFDQSRTNETRTGAWLGRLGYEAQLRPGSSTDSLSRFRVTGLVGLADDRRNGRHDHGPAYGLDAAAVLYVSGPDAEPLVLRVLGSSATLGPRTLRRLSTLR